MGDWNTAHREIDLAFPKSNVENSGFRPEERAEIDRWLAAGWIDAFRRFEPGPGHYTWWSQRKTVRERNIGWRIDFVLASRAVMPFVRSCVHPARRARLGSLSDRRRSRSVGAGLMKIEGRTASTRRGRAG